MSRPSVVTFYSYKGGVGRTFVLANVAVMLARWGFHVLCVDFDLEAPGLRHYLHSARSGPGIVDFLLGVRSSVGDWRGLVRPFEHREIAGRLDLLAAGDDASDGYGQQLALLDWDELYREHDLGNILETVRREFTGTYDLVLVDSRTGLTDAGGIATAQLADVLVFAFAPNRQGLDGSQHALRKARELRRRLPIERPPFLELPLPTRFDNSAVGPIRENWLQRCASDLAKHYDQWREKDARPELLLDLLRIPYKPRWSFGEPLAVLEERATDPDTVSYAIATLAAFLARRLEDSGALVRSRDEYVRDVELRNRAVLGRGEAQRFEFDLFLSFRAEDAKLVRGLRAELERQGRDRDLTVFMADADIALGSDWLGHLQRTIRSARHVAVLASAPLTPWQQAEVASFLLDAQSSKGERKCLPIWLGDTKPSDMLSQFQGIRSRDLSLAELASRIWQAVGKDAPSDRRAAQAVPILRPFDPRADYLAAVLDAHRRLIPFFPEDKERLIDDVFVELDLEARPERDTAEAVVELRDGMRPGTTLRELLLPKTAPERAPRWTILGEPGAGKSTLARNLARSLAAEDRIAIYVSLGRLGAAELEPCAIAAQEAVAASPEHTSEMTEWLRRSARGGEAVFLLDGLDEVDPERIDAVAARIVQLAERDYPRAPIAVLARPIALERRELGRRFRRAQVRALDPKRRLELLRNLLGEDDAARLSEQLERSDAMRELCENPLMLTLTALVARDAILGAESLPSYRGKLYDAAVDLLLRRGHCAEQRGVRDRLAARRILAALSLSLHEAGGEAWTRTDLSDSLWSLRRSSEELNFALKETWGTNDVFLDDIGHNAGLLGPHDGPHAPWRFLHRSLREFLAAAALAARPEELKERVSTWVREVEEHARRRRGPQEESSTGVSGGARDPERWGEVYSLLCSMVPDPFEILTVIRGSSPALALRTIRSVEALPGERGLRFMLETDGWNPDDAARAVRVWGLSLDEARQCLRARAQRDAQPGNPDELDELGRIWWAMSELEIAPTDEEFCAWARLPERRPEIPWVTIPAGEFVMGDSRGGGWEQPAHGVRVAAFRMSATPVTSAQFGALLRPSRTRGRTAKHPAIEVSWWMAWLFCRWMGARLPTEAEWEYACRAGTTKAYWFGDVESELAAYAWYEANSGGAPKAVGQKPANPFGLHDMHGNVWEWCEDEWHGSYEGAPSDGSAWLDGGGGRVIRGGSWDDPARWCRSAFRDWRLPGLRSAYVGFRPARFITE